MNPIGDQILIVGLFVAFIGVVWWAYGARRKKRFEKDGDIPFKESD